MAIFKRGNVYWYHFLFNGEHIQASTKQGNPRTARQIEAAFKTLKSELGLRPIYHQVEKRVEAHIFVAFLAYALSVTLKQRLATCAPGLTPRAVLEKLATVQMLDVCLPTTDGRWLIMPRYTQPEPEQMLLLHQLHLSLPSQPPPRIKPAENVADHPVQLKL